MADNFELCLSFQVLEEYREVLARPKFSRSQERASVMLDALQAISLEVHPSRRLMACHDESDNRLLECAEAGGAAFLVTGNLRDFPPAFGPTKILSPRAFLEEIGF